MDSIDDDYMELLDMESMEEETHLPLNFNSIISGDIKASPETAKRLPLRRCLSLNESNKNVMRNTKTGEFEPKTPEMLKPITESITPYSSRMAADSGRCFKRPEAPLISPIHTKRYKTNEKENNEIVVTDISPLRHTLRKSMSMNDANIMSALARCKF